jgi:hypothetical protein
MGPFAYTNGPIYTIVRRSLLTTGAAVKLVSAANDSVPRTVRCEKHPSRPPPPRPAQDDRQPGHGDCHRQQVAEALPPPLAVGHVRQHLADEALAVAGGRRNRSTQRPRPLRPE